MRAIKTILLLFLIALLAGCGATRTAIQKRDLRVETQMTEAIILEPMMDSQRCVYVRVRDASGNNLRKSMQTKIIQELQDEGIAVTNDPAKCNLLLRATIIKASRVTEEQAYSTLKATAEGALLGGGIAVAAGSDLSSTLGAALTTSAIGFLADTLVEDVYYAFVVDVELRERPLQGDVTRNVVDSQVVNGKPVVELKRSKAKNKKSDEGALEELTDAVDNLQAAVLEGESIDSELYTASRRDLRKSTSSVVRSTVTRGEDYKWLIYRTRVVTVANQVNLTLDEALPAVQEKTASSLAESIL
ncbi:MAG: complement resistance protein TraT [Desulfovibrionales bacterium]|nr:complement resistance protein TraT [Desulfovibrionales bacterium]